MMRKILLINVLLGSAAFGQQHCGELTKLTLEHARVTHAEDMAAGEFKAPGGQALTNLPAFCRVQVESTPTSGSQIAIEIWMPAAGWNGRFLGVGNGGFAGSLNYDSLAEGVRNGYVTGSTDTGHEAGMVDASWALGNREKIVDFGFRGIHEMTVNAKAVLHGFYGSDAKKTFFNGCSNGGRQALMEAQRYPNDYDGILAGAPANYWTHLLANSAVNALATLGNASSYISPKKLPAIQAANLAACDAQDGLKDGIISDPMKCEADVSALACKGAETDGCLTPPQMTALKQLYAGTRLPDGTPVFPGYPPGGEAAKGSWDVWITGPAPQQSLMYGFSTQFYKNMEFNDRAWDFHTYSLERNVKATDDKLAGTLNATNADLSAFQAHGGKLVLYHGWNDPAIAAPNTLNYYNSVVAKMGAGGVHEFVRVFMVPGMLHCSGGDAPSEIGQFRMGGEAATSLDAALIRWVEESVAPEQVIARKMNGQGAVVQSRPVCAYPKTAKYKGSGSMESAANFSCAQ